MCCLYIAKKKTKMFETKIFRYVLTTILVL